MRFQKCFYLLWVDVLRIFSTKVANNHDPIGTRDPEQTFASKYCLWITGSMCCLWENVIEISLLLLQGQFADVLHGIIPKTTHWHVRSRHENVCAWSFANLTHVSCDGSSSMTLTCRTTCPKSVSTWFTQPPKSTSIRPLTRSLWWYAPSRMMYSCFVLIK